MSRRRGLRGFHPGAVDVGHAERLPVALEGRRHGDGALDAAVLRQPAGPPPRAHRARCPRPRPSPRRRPGCAELTPRGGAGADRGAVRRRRPRQGCQGPPAGESRRSPPAATTTTCTRPRTSGPRSCWPAIRIDRLRAEPSHGRMSVSHVKALPHRVRRSCLLIGVRGSRSVRASAHDAPSTDRSRRTAQPPAPRIAQADRRRRQAGGGAGQGHRGGAEGRSLGRGDREGRGTARLADAGPGAEALRDGERGVASQDVAPGGPDAARGSSRLPIGQYHE